MRERPCPDCTDGPVNRREFVKQAGATTLAAGVALPLVNAARSARAATVSPSDSTVGQLYASLSDDQRKVICMPVDHKLRYRINANWAITEPAIGGDFYNDDQRQLIDKILHETTSGDGYELLQKQMRADSPKGVDSYHIAIFGHHKRLHRADAFPKNCVLKDIVGRRQLRIVHAVHDKECYVVNLLIRITIIPGLSFRCRHFLGGDAGALFVGGAGGEGQKQREE